MSAELSSNSEVLSKESPMNSGGLSLVSVVTLLGPLLLLMVLFDSRLSSYASHIETKPIRLRNFSPSALLSRSRQKIACSSNKNTRFIIVGGSGFIGSWVCRFLLFRKERFVRIIDIRQPPGDVIAHGAQYIRANVVHEAQLRDAINCVWVDTDGVLDSDFQAYELVVFHCAATRQFHQTLSIFGSNIFKKVNVEGTRHIINILTNECELNFSGISLIGFGDEIAYRSAPNWFDPRQLAKQINSPFIQTFNSTGLATKQNKPKFINCYAESMYESEILVLEANNSPLIQGSNSNRDHGKAKYLKTATLVPSGIVTGHLDDNFLHVALQSKLFLLFSWNVPLLLIHVEDIAIAALKLSNVLLDNPLDTEGQSFILANTSSTLSKSASSLTLASKSASNLHPQTHSQSQSPQKQPQTQPSSLSSYPGTAVNVTTSGHVFSYLTSRSESSQSPRIPNMRLQQINPAIVLFFSYLILLYQYLTTEILNFFGFTNYAITTPLISGATRKQSSLASTLLRTMTPGKFNVWQITHIPGSEGVRHTRKILGWKSEFSVEECVAGVAEEWRVRTRLYMNRQQRYKSTTSTSSGVPQKIEQKSRDENEKQTEQEKGIGIELKSI